MSDVSKVPGYKRIAKRHKAFRKNIMETWESFIFLGFAFDKIRSQVKDGAIEPFAVENLSNSFTGLAQKRVFDKKDTLGIIDHLHLKINPQRALLEPVAYTESYLQDLCEIVYKDFPGRLLGKKPEQLGVDNDKQQGKMIELIVKSSSREEILDKIIEEKIRGIFYGNPLDFYISDKANIGIGDYFSKHHIKTRDKLAEIIARRNIYAHNSGKVDSKYLREVKNSTLILGRKAIIDEAYIREAIIVLRGFSSLVTKLVIENVYKVPCTISQLNTNVNSFNMYYDK